MAKRECDHMKDTHELLKSKIMKDPELMAIFWDRIYDSTREETEVKKRPFIVYKEWIAKNEQWPYHVNSSLVYEYDLVLYMPRDQIKRWRHMRDRIKQIIIRDCNIAWIRFDRFWWWMPYKPWCRFIYPIEWKFTEYQCHVCQV